MKLVQKLVAEIGGPIPTEITGEAPASQPTYRWEHMKATQVSHTPKAAGLESGQREVQTDPPLPPPHVLCICLLELSVCLRVGRRVETKGKQWGLERKYENHMYFYSPLNFLFCGHNGSHL